MLNESDIFELSLFQSIVSFVLKLNSISYDFSPYCNINYAPFSSMLNIVLFEFEISFLFLGLKTSDYSKIFSTDDSLLLVLSIYDFVSTFYYYYC